MQKPKISCVYLDMDGVIADFAKRYEELFDVHPSVAEQNANFDDLFDMFIQTGNFATLDFMPGAERGIEYLRKAPVPTQILSSTGHRSTYDEISKQKMIWLQSKGITFNPIFVPGKKYKKDYATPTSIVIDDMESVIDDWKEAGGIGILHKDWDTTLAILRMYI